MTNVRYWVLGLLLLSGCVSSHVGVQVRHNTEDVQTFIVSYSLDVPPLVD